MADKRIKIAQDKSKLLKDLKASDNSNGPFQTYVEVMVFAAALGAKRKKRVPLIEIAKDVEPIRRDYFDRNLYELIINLLAIAETQLPQILADDDETNEQRIKIFEEYANGGLEILQDELRGAVDYYERILLMINTERLKRQPEEDFDLSRFLA